VGQLTGGIAHDFNNLLTIILANLQLLDDELAPGSSSQQLATSATRAALRGAELTRKLLVFARRQRLETQSLDVNELVSNMTAMLARTLGEHIRVDEALTPDLPLVLADAGQLETALLNLAVNARDAMPHGGRLVIETSAMTSSAAAHTVDGGIEAGSYIVITVSDSGVGMSAEVAARAFEPFFTTKDAGKGTGLGLSMVYGFVKQSGGYINLQSDLGQGTTITLLLPQSTRVQARKVGSASDEEPTGSETILLVEDDEQVRRVTRTMLRGLGYRVLSAGNANTALQVLDANPDVRLLLTDVVLADGPSGPELAGEARQRRPDLKVLFVSGYVRDVAAINEQLQEDAHFLAKPFRKAELAEKVRTALDELVL